MYTRQDLEAKCRDIVVNIQPIIEEVLNGENVVDVFVTGGCSSMPIVRQELDKYFQGRCIRKSIQHPVVLGAAR